ncbi:hypothetical protein PMIN01_00629 [Paraphaeosphaeria minitans]|uniref:Uncharacterized protein n=1 Tax=Paraphaeosphaeria minitans TaxID=565426 RepID=A0A9P6GTY9_9PLEO|nr:hypothetical protein PMIN01_00629 [Paraphaeosphaeria minitans]
MNSSARLYERLDQIPSDPEDPECLEDVVVCAFGAFERYYVLENQRWRISTRRLRPTVRSRRFPLREGCRTRLCKFASGIRAGKRVLRIG